jgi:hypothetical protein
MAHYAFLDENNVVVEVIVGVDETELIEGLDTETWYSNFRGLNCKRTSYNAAKNGFRFNYAAIGYSYHEDADAFIASKPCDHANLNTTNYLWECADQEHDRETLAE